MSEKSHFIAEIIKKDLASGKHDAVVTRFPPEPNGYLHIGHAKAICLNFGLAEQFNGKCHLRLDDTNPANEDQHFVDQIKDHIQWLGFSWEDHEYYASDYYETLYEYACQLIKKGLAYVCTLTPEQFKEYRGVPTRPGKESPHRNRSVEENLDLFARMKQGEFEDGSYVLRAKIDMASPNLHMRDPAMYRIKRQHHFRTGDAWCIYPMYDFAHGLSDAIEGITHSLCSLEFEVHRPLYDWFIEALGLWEKPPHQYEFARLDMTYTVMSKRLLQPLVDQHIVDGWDDPRMSTLAGIRRRGVPPEAVRNFCDEIGITKYESLTDIGLFEHHVRQVLNKKATRYMGVMNPLKVMISNMEEEEELTLGVTNNPEDPTAGTRNLIFTNEIYIEKEDFQENPEKKFFRLAPGKVVRLRHAGFIQCDRIEKNEKGEIVALYCTRYAEKPEGVKVKATLHWVSAKTGIPAKVRHYQHLFTVPEPRADKEKDFTEFINPNSMQEINAVVEPAVKEAPPGIAFQFERLGYYCIDKYGTAESLIINQTVALRDTKGK